MAENNSSATLKTAEGEDERALFEAVASDHGLWPKAIERDAKGNYLLLTTANGWMWWQHARSIRTAPPQAAPAAVAVPDERWCPDVCPITGRDFFMWVTHHESGDDVPTYGGPFDSYTIPTQDKDGSFSCERYDHDFGGWKDWENVGLMLVDDQSFVVAPDNPRYYEIEQFATPALPATEDSSAGDLAEVQAEPVSSDPVAWHSKLYGTCWMHKQPYHLDAGTHFFVRGNPNPVATVLSGAAIQWHTGTAAFEHGTFFYTAPQAQPADALDAKRWRAVAHDPKFKGWGVARMDEYSECQILTGEEANEAIDAAMAAAQEGGNAAKEA